MRFNSGGIFRQSCRGYDYVTYACVFYFCVGHLLGRNNVIDRLRKKGYAVQHIPVSESIEG